MLQSHQGTIRKGAVQSPTRMVEPSRAHKSDVSQDTRGGCKTEAGGASQKFVPAPGTTRESWPLYFEGTIRIPYDPGISPESSVIPFLASATCIY